MPETELGIERDIGVETDLADSRIAVPVMMTESVREEVAELPLIAEYIFQTYRTNFGGKI
jgi:hypothetical protein